MGEMTNEEAIALLQVQMNFNRIMQRGWGNTLIETDAGNIVDGALYANQHKDVADALELAINALRAGGTDTNVPTMPAGQPLTLEQLRGMKGKPAWIERNDEPHDGKWLIVEYADTENPDKTLYTREGTTYSDYGTYFTAYAYPPAHIDREAWEPCGLCGTLHDEIMCRFSKKTEYDQSTTSRYAMARFCPNCGRPLTEETWAELEKRVRG